MGPVAELDVDPVAAGFRVVVSGHSHKPSVEEHDGVLYVNSGYAKLGTAPGNALLAFSIDGK